MKELRKISQEELREILELPKLWLESDSKEGELTNLSYCDLRYCDLRYADLSYCDLRYADLSYADLRYCKLRYADLRYCNLRHANLKCADLSYCILSDADLSYAYLRYANLTNANLTKAELYKTNLSNAKVNNMISVENIGGENRTIYYFYKGNRVICGCFDNTLEEFKKAVKEKYGENYGSYEKCIKLFEVYEEE